ncbi:MAG TPA: hypothetical protein VFH78_05015 [Candidatus Thermoplasmatota archaeon]|nr:hypothetical protein [Candidatus Thermoplasmatota archaeon]
MPTRIRRWAALPRWTEPAALAFVGLWAIGWGVSAILGAINTAGALLLPGVPVGQNAWRPAQPLGDLPFDLQLPLVALQPLLLFAVVALGISTWADAAKRRRFLVILACIDVVLLVTAFDALMRGRAVPDSYHYLIHQVQVAPFVGIGLALAWPSRRGRPLALAGALLLFAAYANIYWVSRGVGPDSWFATEARMAGVTIALATARALAPLLIGAGIVAAAHAVRARLPAPAPQPAPAAE